MSDGAPDFLEDEDFPYPGAPLSALPQPRDEFAERPFAPLDSEPAEFGEIDQNSTQALLPLIDVGKWRGDPPPRRSLWGDWLPLHQTTMLTGDGGVGKSLFEQVLLTHIALGRTF